MCMLPLHAHIYGRAPSEISLITPARPRLALQACTHHLLRALRLCVPRAVIATYLGCGVASTAVHAARA